MSRIITHPSTVELNKNHAVVIVDISDADRERLELYLQINFKDFDVYLYDGSIGDLQWLNHVASISNVTLVNNSSQVNCSHSIRYGEGCDIIDPLTYFEQLSVD